MGRGYRSFSGRFVIDLIDSIDWQTTFGKYLMSTLDNAESVWYDEVAEPPGVFPGLAP